MMFSKNGKQTKKRSGIIKSKEKRLKKAKTKKDPEKRKSTGGLYYRYLPWRTARLHYHEHETVHYEWSQWYHNGPGKTSKSYNGKKISALLKSIEENIKSLENLDKILDNKHNSSIKKTIPSKKINFYEYSKSYLKRVSMKEPYNAFYLCHLTDF
ncbi:unnamed protein product [Blepharisma stoltei]|uniref:Uncharacterized protein n=1 Tax=Blepharisma stoltei TaxID=1481888 RepID=A0AAU9J0N0_9CILI|nr:unnamed protein product [Blepharisma stoltei]